MSTLKQKASLSIMNICGNHAAGRGKVRKQDAPFSTIETDFDTRSVIK